MSCPLCNTWNLSGETCVQVRCLACRVEQCYSNGRSRGSCRYCHAGMLPGWSGSNNPDIEGRAPGCIVRTDIRCTYKGCGEMAVYNNLPGAKRVACKVHGDGILARKRDRRGGDL